MLTYVDKFVTMLKHVAKRGNKKTSTLTTKQQCDPENSKRRRENYSEKSEENTNQKAKKEATVNTETERKSQKRASLSLVKKA